MVAYLKKPEGSEEFHQIVDFLNTSHIRYALTENPTIYVSLIKQFWETATARTLDTGEIELTTTIDGKVKIVTKASVRRHLKFTFKPATIKTVPPIIREVLVKLLLDSFGKLSISVGCYRKGRMGDCLYIATTEGSYEGLPWLTWLTNRWLSMKKDIASCGSKYLAYSEVEVEYQGSSGLLLQPELWVVEGLTLERCSTFGKKDKLEPSYVGTFEIFGYIGPTFLFDELRVLMPRVVKSRDEIFSRWGYCDNHDLSRLDNQSIERDRLIGIGFVLNFVKFISFTFGDKEMISVIEAIIREVFVKLLLKSSGKLSIRHGLYVTIVCYVLLAIVVDRGTRSVPLFVVLERDRLKALMDLIGFKGELNGAKIERSG
ncbi:hypothetical protein Tco_0428365 [Tanacetum coccineum]